MTSPRSLAARALRCLFRDSRGATAVEYGLICALIVVAMISAFTGLASITTSMWNNVSEKVIGASSGS